MVNKLIAEFIGTFFLYLIIAMCVITPGAESLTPLAVGLGLAALVYACGHISKAHFNPATTITFTVAGTHPKRDFWPYISVIVLAAICAAITARFLNTHGDVAAVVTLDPHPLRLIVGEFLFTFALMWICVNVAIAKTTRGNEFYALAIGAIVAAGAYAIGPVTFAAFNPAITLAMCLNDFIPWSMFPLYVLAQSAAALAAGLLFRWMGLVDLPKKR